MVEGEGKGKGDDKEGGGREDAPCLFAFPAECNFSGQKHDLRTIGAVKRGALGRGRWYVLLDAAKHAATSPLDLSRADHKADFVAVSFYKMFGLPAGVGAVVARRDAVSALRKESYFSGGTVLAARADADVHMLRGDASERFEDGTLPFSALFAVEAGLKRLREIGMDRVASHTSALRTSLAAKLAALRHHNGQAAAIVYGPAPTDKSVGSVVAFNVLRLDGRLVPYTHVEEVASAEGVSLRTGAFCNPGAVQEYLGATGEDVERFLSEGKVCGDDKCVIGGKATGAVRASFGYMSCEGDAEALVALVKRHFVASEVCKVSEGAQQQHEVRETEAVLSGMRLFPIKSCGAQKVEEWPLGGGGLRYDREWALIDPNGIALTAKGNPSMVLISPCVCLASHTLTVTSPMHPSPLSIPLNRTPSPDQTRHHVVVCGAQGQGAGYTHEVDKWFSTAVGRPVRLVRQGEGRGVGACIKGKGAAYHSNGAALMAVSEETLQELERRVARSAEGSRRGCKGGEKAVLADRLRPNLVFRGGGAEHWEDAVQTMTLPTGSPPEAAGAGGELVLQGVGPCFRCLMVNVDPGDATVGAEPFLTLSGYRRDEGCGRVKLGVLLQGGGEEGGEGGWLRVPCKARVLLGS